MYRLLTEPKVMSRRKEGVHRNGTLRLVEGYEYLPPAEVLLQMTPAELAMVPNFTVSNEHVSITWPGNTDLNGVDMRVVRLEPGGYTIYSEGGPPIGTGLNKLAIITIKGCQITTGPGGEEALVRTLEEATEELGGRLLRYDPVRREWVFEVDAFV
ncbi:Nucleoporin autopeptidase [Giardia muris]|uniref:Nucleoporin autopeptidase n=1 Tax=Giardia muris TaxID=5742 RepID=A0A4Z1SZU5_GIAMU|nr:Nucleoporin autopeptidase [Giardia muris]|eukprot:TNJ26177.1 Nucleoporin autopeptidase [Giardia muris]